MIAVSPYETPEQKDPSMEISGRRSANALATGASNLWIDSVGGFRVLEGDAFTIGGLGGEAAADVSVRCSWRSRMVTLVRRGDDYWLKRIEGDTNEGRLMGPLVSGERLAMANSSPEHTPSDPQLRLHTPSPLSPTAVLSLDPPHRFAIPVDAFLLVHQTILIGPDRSNHIRVPRLNDALVMIKQGSHWALRCRDRGWVNLLDGEPVEVQGLVMTLRTERGYLGSPENP
jgi:hypothetical protein